MYNRSYQNMSRDEPICDALLEMCHVVTHNADNGSYLYTTFNLKEEYK